MPKYVCGLYSLAVETEFLRGVSYGNQIHQCIQRNKPARGEVEQVSPQVEDENLSNLADNSHRAFLTRVDFLLHAHRLRRGVVERKQIRVCMDLVDFGCQPN